jgi:RNA polymerase sigma factor (sigma-70 family)
LVSRSNLFLEGVYKLLESQSDIKIATETLNPREIKKYLTEIKPEFLFLDNRAIKLNIHRLSDSIAESNPDTKVILFGNHTENETNSPNVIFISDRTSSSELIQTLKSVSKNAQAKEINNAMEYNLTQRETEIIRSIENGLSNKEIAKRFSITEKTIKAHLNSIFRKLGLRRRYQLIVYARQFRRRAK